MKKTVAELWEDIFNDYDIINAINTNGYFIISANQIRPYKEPRLMTKFDFSSQVPQIFKNNNLGILPITNGEYIIGKFNMFENISSTKYDEIEPIKVSLPEFIETIDPDNIYSESNALNVALLSGMLKDVLQEDVVETIQGKMRATGFNFLIDGVDGTKLIEIEKPAMEIDGGYEGKSKISLVEAKNYLPKDFIIRQLYFPYRHWVEKVHKPIVPIFFAYDNGIYTFFIYEFTDKNKYNSLKLQEIRRYILCSRDSEKLKIDIFNNIELIDDLPQDKIPFPQADTFNRVIALVEMIDSEIDNAYEVAEEFNMEPRQGHYYIAAAKYLGLITNSVKSGKYIVTPSGFLLNNLDMKSRNEHLVKTVLKHKVFYYTYKYYLENKKLPTKEYIIDLMKQYTDLTNSVTLNRRASTVRGWIEWIIGCQI